MAIPRSYVHVDIDPCSFLAVSKPSMWTQMRWLCEDIGRIVCRDEEIVIQEGGQI